MPVTRVVMVKLDDAHASAAARREVAAHSLEVLRAVPGIAGVEVGVPADDRSGEAWDLAILVRFERAEDIAPYLVEPRHRAYVDDYLSPKLAAIKAWNFETL